MKKITNNLRTEIVESDDGTKRYSLRKVWDESKPSLAIIMICPSSSGEVAVDNSTMLTLGNCYRLGYGGVTIVNLFSTINDFSLTEAEDEDAENIKAIIAAAETADCVVLGAGTGKAKNARFQQRLEQVAVALRPYEAKLHYLCDKNGGSRGLHPLSPRLREWHVSPLAIGELIDVPVGETPTKPKRKTTQKEKTDQ